MKTTSKNKSRFSYAKVLSLLLLIFNLSCGKVSETSSDTLANPKELKATATSYFSKVNFTKNDPNDLDISLDDEDYVDYDVIYQEYKNHSIKLLTEIDGYTLSEMVLDAYSFAYAYEKTKAVYQEYDGNDELKSKKYRGIVFDLIDSNSAPHRLGVNGGMDQVSGYTLLSIRRSLRGVSSWKEWRDQLIERAKTDKEAKAIYDLFKHYS